jgi:SAM-dependent methyltransferase
MKPDLPSQILLQKQAAWLAPVRARLLRRVGIAHRKRVLDLGAGYGAVTGELVRRSGGPVTALDRSWAALSHAAVSFAGAGRVCGEAEKLPLADDSFELIFCQLVLMWASPVETIQEIRRVLRPEGILIALEPDYGGMIEHPPEITTKALWLSALERAGADPLIGRKLPGLLAAQGFEVRIDLLPELAPPSLLRFELLRGLPLTSAEKQSLTAIEAIALGRLEPWDQIVHLPFVLITATRPPASIYAQASPRAG